MIQEYLSGGDLKEYLLESRNQKTTLLLDIQLSLALDIASAGQYLEQNNFIHRTSCYVKSGQGMLPLRWMPPEAFIDGVYSTKSDVW
ncbi:hypothetical protein FSP39_000002 [Pinctada imbricata]|uniref:Serine-threonine/tyrosine-protein kinase catalytic domain-containing protein n=1 Tax=Pinctada imbricata TaxID=66713 RepID=A0AA88XXE4_PINIB|nr:hypothetical protein FSP39_000002 [Pinctada imbricata]